MSQTGDLPEFMLAVDNDGPQRRWFVRSRRERQTVEIPIEVAQQVAECILSTVRKPMLHPFPIEAAVIDDFVVMVMPSEATEWEMSDQEAVAFAAALQTLVSLDQRPPPVQ